MNSPIFQEFERWLGNDENSNWNEYYSEQVAHGVLPKFENCDWQQLKEVILSKPQYWQERCADACGEERSATSVEILKLLLYSSFLEVKIAAASELEWTEEPIERGYSAIIEEIISEIPSDEISSYPELEKLLFRTRI